MTERTQREEYKARHHYEEERIVREYEGKRFSSLLGRLKDRREKRAVRKVLGRVRSKLRILDMPCGTGRFQRLLLEGGNHRVVEADISHEMLRFARRRWDSQEGVLGYIRCEAERLPFRSQAFDLVFCFRFLFHLPVDTRITALSELARVSQGYVIVDYRYTFSALYLSRWIRHRLGISKRLRQRYTIPQISAELEKAGLLLVKWVPVVWLFSEKVVLLCQRQSGAKG